MRKLIFFIPLFFLLIFWSCQDTNSSATAYNGQLFQSMPASNTGVDFANNLAFDKDFNIYTYRNFYNGGGVALGDVNKDGLVDVYLTANMEKNRLYLNKGDFKFEDITRTAKVGGERGWSTGVSMADVNGDEWLDIYVCNSGDIEGDNKRNELYINNQDGTFTEAAEAYGLADRGYSTHAAFFDFDRDGDLDVYLLNNSYQAIGSFNLRKNLRNQRDSVGGDKLFENVDGKFIDISEEANILGSIIGFGLGVTVGDINNDQWLDIYVSNDFFERDYLYINQKDGTFKETLTEQMQSISGASMGADMADINNDGLGDIFVTEMLPYTNERIKTSTTFENWDRYQYNLDNGYYHQFTRNMLQLNNGDNTFSEIGRLAGVEASDWSWGALMTDFDNDGLKDIFIANGIYQDLTNQDFINYIAASETIKQIITDDGVDYKALVAAIPSNPIPNFYFKNRGNFKFENASIEVGLGEPGFSNGSAYGDLDNDGDLDLVTNNVNSPVAIFQNHSTTNNPENNWIGFDLQGEKGNVYAVGAKVILYCQGQQITKENIPTRGFESTMDHRIHLGIGTSATIDSILIYWPDGNQSMHKSLALNQYHKLNQPQNSIVINRASDKRQTGLFTIDSLTLKNIRHQENKFVDFDRDRLLFHMLSAEGPKPAIGDINGDGRDDIFMPGPKEQSSRLFLQTAAGKFIPGNNAVFEQDKKGEDIQGVFFDADGDKDLDIYIARGGSENNANSRYLFDAVYFNNGKGTFTKGKQLLPNGKFENSGCVQAADFDQDGDQDLFVGSRHLQRNYGAPTNAYILENDGKGVFTNVTEKVAADLLNIGMVTDGDWSDIDGDGDLDLLVIGEWLPIMVFENENGKLSLKQSELNETSQGWWNCMTPGDIDADGDIDYVVGNHGWNSRFRASVEKPVTMYVNDFDQNGQAEQIINIYFEDQAYPLALRHELVMQIPSLKKKYLKYEDFKNETAEDIFGKEKLDAGVSLVAKTFANSILLNDGNGNFQLKDLPVKAQFSPMFGMAINDFNKDGYVDLLTGGNFSRVKPEVGKYDADFGLFLTGDKSGNFSAQASQTSGIKIHGEIRDMSWITVRGERCVLVSRNNDSPLLLRYSAK